MTRIILFKNYIIALIALCAFFCTASAQTSRQGNAANWNLQQCFDYAQKNNILINLRRLDQKISAEQLSLSKAALLPDLYASITQIIGHGQSSGSIAGGNGISPSGNYGISSSWTLYQGGSLRNAVGQQRLLLGSAELNVKEQENALVLSIASSYLGILLDKESVSYQLAVLSSSQAQVLQARQRFNVGSIAEKDLIQLQSQQASDRSMLIGYENLEKQDLLTLKQLLQLPSETVFDILVPQLDTNVIISRRQTGLDSVQLFAFAHRPEILNSGLQLEVARIALKRAVSGYLPVLTASGSISSAYNHLSNPFFSQLNSNFYQQVGLTLSVPIFTRRLNRTNVAIAKINIDQAKLNQLDSKTTLLQTVERAYINLQTSISQYDAAREALKYNTESYRIATAQLRIGSVNMVEFLQQKTLYLQSLQVYLQARYSSLLSEKIYYFYNGYAITL